jgi:hypothetical protein
MKIELNESEIEHILYLIEVNRKEGWFTGNEKRYWRAIRGIEKKMQNPSNTISAEIVEVIDGLKPFFTNENN